MAEQDPTAAARFMDLTDPRYAYMFGFLQADGHLSQQSRQRGRLTVELNVRDIDLLHEFQRLTPYNSSVTERTRATNFASASHTAVWACSALEARTIINELGIPYGRKSKTIAPPRVDFSRRDYIRGVIDADGSVGYTGKGFPFVSLTTASTAIGAYLCHYAKKITGAERTIKRNARDGVYNILYTNEAAVELASHLYYDGCLALERKKAAAGSLGAWTRPADMPRMTPRRRWAVAEDLKLLDIGDAAAVAVELGRSESACRQRLTRLRTGCGPWPAR
ncbi:LAGLIDADG family homing endonuclease [Streptomyces sp. NBC_01439]|uniref:LAGLIDADG family homing endonuclease n=1 Tax=Streptomyces sp. NBC_01439 TaxID=2903867 RepID=UPI002E2CE1AC|nr:LAGLIDADG family homing endonuclease [Streptomyces sp. NBC_01439]